MISRSGNRQGEIGVSELTASFRMAEDKAARINRFSEYAEYARVGLGPR
jgi:hypothetical protein